MRRCLATVAAILGLAWIEIAADWRFADQSRSVTHQVPQGDQFSIGKGYHDPKLWIVHRDRLINVQPTLFS